MIDSFSGKYRFLSNFFHTPVEFEGAVYLSVEHAYQAAKTHDPVVRAFFTRVISPVKAKHMGRLVSLRSDWNDVRDDVMLELLRKKFTHSLCDLLRFYLVQTWPAKLVEGNTWHDNYWGDCRCGRSECLSPGENRLGTLLMQVRDELISPGVA